MDVLSGRDVYRFFSDGLRAGMGKVGVSTGSAAAVRVCSIAGFVGSRSARGVSRMREISGERRREDLEP